jgi:ABC-type sugar transport system ATPase subunit
MPEGVVFHEVSKRYPGVVALRNVSVTFPSGTTIGLVGENGAGKSTLTKILAGLIPASAYEGSVTFDGQAIAFHSAHDAGRAGVAVIPQELALHDRMSIAENIMLGRWPTKGGRIDWSALRRTASSVMARVGLLADPRTIVRALRPGEQQLVAICRALVRDSRLLLLDEPTAALDKAEVDRLLNVIRNLSAAGVTILYVSHRLDEVFAICQQIVVMRDGQIVADLHTSETDREAVVASMIGRNGLERKDSGGEHSAGPVVLRARFDLPDERRRGAMKLSGIELELRSGEVVGLVGLIGSGRTETLWSIAGAMKRQGEVTMDGLAVAADPADAVRHGIGLVTEERRATGIFPLSSVSRNVAVAAYDLISGFGIVKAAAEDERAETVASQLRIKMRDVRTPITSLSGGNQQKVLLARWLACKAKVLLLDEPARGIDVGAKAEIYRLLCQLARERGLAVLTTSSDVSELIGVCDRFLVIRGGRIVANIPAKEASESRLLALAADRALN